MIGVLENVELAFCLENTWIIKWHCVRERNTKISSVRPRIARFLYNVNVKNNFSTTVGMHCFAKACMSLTYRTFQNTFPNICQSYVIAWYVDYDQAAPHGTVWCGYALPCSSLYVIKLSVFFKIISELYANYMQ